MGITKKELERREEEVTATPALQHPKLAEAGAVAKLSASLGERLLKFYSYGSVRGKVLVLYFTHPAMLAEFERDKSKIKDAMREIYKNENLKNILYFTDIKAEAVATVAVRETKTQIVKDSAEGTFEIHSDDVELRRIFERIQRSIQDNNEKIRN